jgi:hypothetical protein
MGQVLRNLAEDQGQSAGAAHSPADTGLVSM